MFLVAAGLVALVAGAELIVRFGSRLARRLRVSSMVIGLTIVSIGTSLPELAVGIDGMRRGAGSLVVGNIVGSNLVNILLVLGLAAVIRPILVDTQLVRLDLPVMAGISVVVLVLALLGPFGFGTGVFLALAGIAYLVLVLVTARNREAIDPMLDIAAVTGSIPAVNATTVAGSSDIGTGITEANTIPVSDSPISHEPLRSGSKWAALDVLLTLAGLGLVLLGAEWLLDGAIGIAEAMGVSETIIGLTVVAIGTSVPELATTLMASIRGDEGIAVGNVLGSCTMNLTLILGVPLLFAGRGGAVLDPSLIYVNLPILVVVALLTVVTCLVGRRMTRANGALFML
ncbi:MAG: calcium/sodium antiporter, partial [Cellulomonadaceae bacterium]|nr:calcium/sodium antiporter [Cellulomonadaceae bacterium]